MKEALRSWNIRRARRRNDKEPNDYLFLDTQKKFLDTLGPALESSNVASVWGGKADLSVSGRPFRIPGVSSVCGKTCHDMFVMMDPSLEVDAVV